MRSVPVTQEMLEAKFGSVFPHLDERQRRRLMAAEARSLGHGGIRLVAGAAGVREATVSAGVDELESGAEPLGRARRSGGGRKRLADTDPGLVPALLALVEPDERGDPMSPLRWTTKSTRDLAGELTRQAHPVSADTVAKLLHAQGFSLQGNAKTLEGTQHPDRDTQFRYISEQAQAHQDAGDPVISVDAKKKEPVGQFANAGRSWRPKGEPAWVATHDFPDPAAGVAIPYGIYDLAANIGWVNVGTDHNTAALAVESVRRWWDAMGQDTYPGARRLLITADAGGANGYRTRAWKTGLADLAAQTGLEITCCHFPPGTSKWNKIKHRLFSAITMNWRGRPLTSHQVILDSIAATTTRTGLRVHATLDTSSYPTGITISRAQFDALPLHRHPWHGDWNYTLHPTPPATPIPAPPATPKPRPDLTWLAHPAITGMPGTSLDTLTAALTTAAPALHNAALARRRGYRPRQTTNPGPRPTIPLTTKLLAAILHDRHGLPHKHIATLTGLRPEETARHTATIRRLLHQTGHTIPPAPTKLATLKDLTTYATQHGITPPASFKTTC